MVHLTRERILDATVALSDSDGLPEMEAIAREAAVGRSTLYRHFAGRDAILDALREEAVQTGAALIEQHLGPALRGEPGARIIDGLVELVETGMRNPTRYRRLMRHDRAAGPELFTRFQEFGTMLMTTAQRRGEITDTVAPDALLSALASLVGGLITEVDRGTVSADDAIALVVRHLRSLTAG